MTLPLRQLEGKYEILQKIREGGMGAIYKVRHRLLEEVRVIKVIRPQFASDDALQERFLREARAAIRLRHPSIAQLHDFAVDPTEGASYMVMEYIDGVTLEDLLRKSGPPGIGLALSMSVQGLRALGYLHRHGYIHRDVAPDNLMLTRDYDGGPLIKLIDLGIVKRIGAGGGLTQTGTFMGKLRYASPEHFAPAETKLDHRSDLYSFGILLYELLTGTCPIRGREMSELVAAHLLHPPLAFEESDPEGKVDSGLRQIVLKLLSKQPDERPQSAAEAISALKAYEAVSEVVLEDLDRTLSDAALLTSEPAGDSSSGSTQGRMDEQFGLVTTPRPEPQLTPVSAPAATVAAGKEVEERLANARLFVRLDQHTKAERELVRLLRRAPEHKEALALLDAVRTALRGHLEELEAALAAVRKRIAKGRFDAARKRLAAATELAPDHPQVAALSLELEAATALYAAEDQRRQGIERSVEGIEKLLGGGEPGEAAAALAKAREEYGEARPLTALEPRIDAALQEAEIGRLLEEAAAHRDEGKLVAALESLQAALQLDPEHEGALTLRAAVDAALAERRRRRRAALRAARSVEAAIRWGEVERALELLAQAEAEHGAVPELVALRAPLLERQRHERRERLIAASRAKAAHGDFDAALEDLREALGVAPGDAEVEELIASLERERQVEEDRRATAATAAAAEIARLIENGEYRRAGRALEAAESGLGEREELGPLRERLNEARRTRAGQAHRSIVAAIEAGDLERAEHELEFATSRGGLNDDERRELEERLAAAQVARRAGPAGGGERDTVEVAADPVARSSGAEDTAEVEETAAQETAGPEKTAETEATAAAVEAATADEEE